MAAGCIATASTLQAWVGAHILWRIIGREARLETPREIVGYLLSAPVICVISTSLSVGALLSLGMIPPAQGFLMWSIWGVGDTLGVVTVFPMVLALLGTPVSAWKGRRALVVSVMSGTFALVVLGPYPDQSMGVGQNTPGI